MFIHFMHDEVGHIVIFHDVFRRWFYILLWLLKKMEYPVALDTRWFLSTSGCRHIIHIQKVPMFLRQKPKLQWLVVLGPLHCPIRPIYHVIFRILGFFSSSFTRKIHHPWRPLAPPISQGGYSCTFPTAWPGDLAGPWTKESETFWDPRNPSMVVVRDCIREKGKTPPSK